MCNCNHQFLTPAQREARRSVEDLLKFSDMPLRRMLEVSFYRGCAYGRENPIRHQLKASDKMREVICPRCSGRGFVNRAVDLSDFDSVRCSRCKGKGKISKEKSNG